MTSLHYQEDRQKREEEIKKMGKAVEIKRIEIDRGHRNGPEIHVIDSNAIVTIYNKRTGKLITKLIARKNQLKRYWKEEVDIPQELIEKAIKNQKLGLNEY